MKKVMIFDYKNVTNTLSVGCMIIDKNNTSYITNIIREYDLNNYKELEPYLYNKILDDFDAEYDDVLSQLISKNIEYIINNKQKKEEV